jgi:hypothetical protein
VPLVPIRFPAGLDRARCDKALPAADFAALLVRLSLRTFEAAFAALPDVVFLGDLRCERALPAAVFDFLLVVLLLKVLEAFDAAFLPVTFVVFAINLVAPMDELFVITSIWRTRTNKKLP